MENKFTRRTLLKKSFAGIVTAAIFANGGYFYARKIEPRLLTVSRINFFHRDIPAGFNRFKIVLFSDTHIGFHFELQHLEQIIGRINSLNPDLILFAGDLMDEPDKCEHAAKIISILEKLSAPFGKFAVFGNHDHGGYGTNLYKNIMKSSGFQLLINQASEISLPDNERIYIAGIDEPMLGKPDLTTALNAVPDSSFKILLSHAPDLADYAVNYNVQLQLSGHSHGGQVKLPLVGPLVKPPFARKYYEGLYTIENGKGLYLYVNRGIGTTRLPFRFLCRPEITVLTLFNE